MDDLVKRADAALKDVTPGPWVFGNTGEEQRLILGGSSERYVANVQIYQTPRHMGAWDEPEREANARFIAAARELVPAMRDRIEADVKRIAELERMLVVCEECGLAIEEDAVEQRARAEAAEARVKELEAVVKSLSRLDTQADIDRAKREARVEGMRLAAAMFKEAYKSTGDADFCIWNMDQAITEFESAAIDTPSVKKVDGQ